MKRYAVLYLATAAVMLPLDLLFLGFVAKPFFTAQVGDMLGQLRMAPAVIFYFLYICGIIIFVTSPATTTWQSALLFGALFGLFCYATFELTSMALLKHWTWPVVIVDITWGVTVTAAAATLGLLLTNWIMQKL